MDGSRIRGLIESRFGIFAALNEGTYKTIFQSLNYKEIEDVDCLI